MRGISPKRHCSDWPINPNAGRVSSTRNAKGNAKGHETVGASSITLVLIKTKGQTSLTSNPATRKRREAF